MIWTGTILTVVVAGVAAAAVAEPVAALGVVAGVWAAASEKIKIINNNALNIKVNPSTVPGCFACEAAC